MYAINQNSSMNGDIIINFHTMKHGKYHIFIVEGIIYNEKINAYHIFIVEGRIYNEKIIAFSIFMCNE